MKGNSLLALKPVKKFINGLGKEIEDYFGEDKACIIGLEDDGVFYAEGLYYWLQEKKRDVTLTTMDDYGKGMEEEKVKGRKILVIDNDIVTGKAYRTAMSVLRRKQEKLKIKDVKFAVLCDRVKVADFSVEDYPVPESWELKDLDEIDRQILELLAQDGRTSFVKIAKETGLTPMGARKRVEKLLGNNFLEIHGLLNISRFYKASATISLEAPTKVVEKMVKKFENCPMVYNLVRLPSGHHHNLIIGLLSPNLRRIDDLIKKQIRTEEGVRNLEADIGELPVVPTGHMPASFLKGKKCLCREKCEECEYFI